MAILTKGQQVEEAIRSGIMRGRWAVGDRLPGEEEMLAELNVSRSTFREALSSLAAEGLIVRKHGSGTYVTGMPATGSVAIFGRAESLTSPVGFWYRRLLSEVRSRVESAGHRAVLCIGHGSTEEEFVSSVNLFDKTVSKDIVGAFGLSGIGPLQSRMDEEGIPTVTIEKPVPVGKHCVVLDFASLTEMACDLLKSHGYDDFALMYFDPWMEMMEGPGHEEIAAEFSRLHSMAVGGRKNRLLPVGPTADDPVRGSYRVFKEWWASGDRPDALFFYDDSLCDVASSAILELGIRVPEDLAIISHANVGRRFSFPVPITSIGFDPVETISSGWGLLEKLINHERIENPAVYVKPHINQGRSLKQAD